jgi:magnesium and cobalt transporter
LKVGFWQRLQYRFFHTPIDSNEALWQALKEAETHHIIDSHSRLLIESTMQLEKMAVRDAMVPKSKMIMIEHTASGQDFLQAMIQSAHSRFPIINTLTNKIQGVVLAKDFLSYLANERDLEFDYKEYLRPAFLVPESKTLGALLRDFQGKKSHLAIVMDEYGEVAGLVTLEDVLEQIVGEIEDEHDLEEDDIIDFSDGRFLLKANTPIETFNMFFKVNIEASEVDTVAGLVIKALTRLPEQMDEISIQGFDFKVLKADSRRIHLLEVMRSEDVNL